jgi:GTPase SAR1 family protein
VVIINIRGTSGSGKSTLVKRYLDEHNHEPVLGQLGPWKKAKVIGYRCTAWTGLPVYIIGRYETQCGGCDSMSYKGLADYQRKHHSCEFQMNRAIEEHERVIQLSSDNRGYEKLLHYLGEK